MTRTRHIVAVAVAVSLTLSGIGSASAAEPDEGYTVAVMPSTVQGKLADQARQNLQNDLEAGLGRAEVQLIGSQKTGEVLGSATCKDAACIQKLATDLSATHVVGLSINAKSRNYEVVMTLYDGSDGSPITVSRDRCEICGLNEVSELVAGQAAVLADKIGELEAPTTIAVKTDPPGATVRIDGRVVGKTPYEDSVLPGEHILQVELKGHVRREKLVNMVASAQEVVDFELEPLPDDGPTTSKLRAQKIAGWSLLGVGVVALAGGSAFLALNGTDVSARCGGDAIGPTGLCRWQYETLPHGVSLAVVGGAAAITGIVLLARAARASKRPCNDQARLTPGPGGLTLRF